MLASGVFLLVQLGTTVLAEDFSEPLSSPSLDVVEVRIGAVLANNSSKESDQRLVAMHKQFNSLFPYSSYHLIKEERQKVPWGGKVGFDIPGGRYVIVVPKEYKGDRVSMKVMVIEGARPIVDTALSLRNHATLLVGGPRQPDGVLILSIGADAMN
ncbi:MAG: hypothetical protein HY270_15640 [Deltaproteobacteria bacterium]|nr:hypothetical protein [Deltaproteobacteria bacterium]